MLVNPVAVVSYEPIALYAISFKADEAPIVTGMGMFDGKLHRVAVTMRSIKVYQRQGNLPFYVRVGHVGGDEAPLAEQANRIGQDVIVAGDPVVGHPKQLVADLGL